MSRRRAAAPGARLDRAPARAAVTFADQAVSSASNFLTGIVIARAAGAADFGAYALAAMVWLVVVGLHRAVIAEPVIVTAGGGDARGLAARGLGAELVLGGAVAAVAAASGGLAAAAGLRPGFMLLAMAPWFPALLVQDYWRAMAFRTRRPTLALADDGAFAAVQIVAVIVFVAAGWTAAPYIIAAWGLGATAGALLGLLWFPVGGGLGAGWDLLVELWGLSRWMLADYATQFASEQAYIAAAAGMLGPAEYGGFRAAFSLMGPAYVIALACGNIGLPGAARLAGDGPGGELHRYTRRLSAGTAACLGLYALLLAVAGRPLLGALYGSEFARYAPVAALAAAGYVLQGVAFGQLTALKAAGRMRRLWRIRLGVAAASLTALAGLVAALGTIGAGWAGLVTSAMLAAAVLSVHRRELGSVGAGTPVGPARP